MVRSLSSPMLPGIYASPEVSTESPSLLPTGMGEACGGIMAGETFSILSLAALDLP